MILRLFSFIILTLFFNIAFADIGETFELQNKRELLAKENENILKEKHIDSLSQTENSRYVENLHIIKMLDEDIFKSQKETVDRLSGTSGSDQYINKSIALFSFLLAIALAISLYMLYLMNKKLNRFTGEEKTFYAQVSELFSVLLINFQSAPNGKKDVAVNRLIILGMLFMFISFLGYLLKTLGV